jgi:hypothetical protein
MNLDWSARGSLQTAAVRSAQELTILQAAQQFMRVPPTHNDVPTHCSGTHSAGRQLDGFSPLP